MRYSFRNDITDFDVTGLKQKIDEKGGVCEGKDYRWALGEEKNIESKKNNFGWTTCLDEDVKALAAMSDGPGTTQRVKRNGEEYILMERDHEVTKEYRDFVRKRTEGAMEETADEMRADGVTARFKMNIQDSEGNRTVRRGGVKKGR